MGFLPDEDFLSVKWAFCLCSGLFACLVGYLPVWWALCLFGGLFAWVVGFLPVRWAICLCIGLLSLKSEIFGTFYSAYVFAFYV